MTGLRTRLTGHRNPVAPGAAGMHAVWADRGLVGDGDA